MRDERNGFRSKVRRWDSKGQSRLLLRLSSAPLCQVHAYIISSLKKEMPSVFGKDTKKKELVNNLAEIYGRIEREHQISPGDFPNLKRMQVMRVRGPTVGRQHLTSWLPWNEGADRAPGRSQSHKARRWH